MTKEQLCKIAAIFQLQTSLQRGRYRALKLACFEPCFFAAGFLVRDRCSVTRSINNTHNMLKLETLETNSSSSGRVEDHH